MRQSLHPLHPLYVHFCVQSSVFVPHQDLHRPEGAATGAAVGAAVSVGACVGAAVRQSLHPLHPLYIHFCVQLCVFVPHQDLHRPEGAATGAAVGAAVGLVGAGFKQSVHPLHLVHVHFAAFVLLAQNGLQDAAAALCFSMTVTMAAAKSTTDQELKVVESRISWLLGKRLKEEEVGSGKAGALSHGSGHYLMEKR